MNPQTAVYTGTTLVVTGCVSLMFTLFLAKDKHTAANNVNNFMLASACSLCCCIFTTFGGILIIVGATQL